MSLKDEASKPSVTDKLGLLTNKVQRWSKLCPLSFRVAKTLTPICKDSGCRLESLSYTFALKLQMLNGRNVTVLGI